ncbi:hypothetical protein [Myroides injenensis]|uniref:hypothetical protein n=1 Tax=Myroides injenensis TaxID=1183151 RepID=UPI002271F2C9|nr:hypothetical protein [Myroides injenensis]
MKKLLLFCIVIFSIVSCEKDENNITSVKELETNSFINEVVPLVKKLPEGDLNLFIKSMVFEKNGILSSWDNNLLKEAYKEDKEAYEKAIVYIAISLGADPNQPIFIVDSHNNEQILSPNKINNIKDNNFIFDNIKVIDNINVVNNINSLDYFSSLEELEPNQPGTYLIENSVNRFLASGCKDGGGVCKITIR